MTETHQRNSTPRHCTGKPALTVRAIARIDELEALRAEWWGLWRRDASATPFQSPAWLIPWWRHVGQGDLLTLALRDGPGGQLVGLAPLYIYAQPQSGSRDILPLGVATSDYLDALFAPGWEAAGAAAAIAHLDSCRDRWDACELPQLRARSPFMNAEAPAGWQQQVESAEPCPALTLRPSSTSPASSGDAMAACVPARMLQNLRYYRKRAQRLGENVRFERADSDNLDEIFEAHLALHSARWRDRGEAGVLGDDGVRAAHRESLPELLAEDLLRLYALRLGDGRIIATLYALADASDGADRRIYYYLGGFDPEYRQLSPGTLLIGHAIEQAIDEGAAAFDFLRGCENYKYLWGAADQPLYRRRLRHDAANEAAGKPSSSFEENFRLWLDAFIRFCREDDLPTLEWFGLFASQRPIIRQTFERHQRGQAVMLVAEVNGVASAQAWIDLERKKDESIGVIWAVRVFPCLQRKGIGRRLIAACERILRDRGFDRAEMTVEKKNSGAQRLYERLGYRVQGRTIAEHHRRTADGRNITHTTEQIVMRKPLSPPHDADNANTNEVREHGRSEQPQRGDTKCRPEVDAGRRERSRI